MKSYVTPLILLIVMAFAINNCQWNNTAPSVEEKNQNDSLKDSFTGEKKYYWEDGKLKATINFVEGQREGINKNYSKTGSLLSEVPYSMGMINGISIQYYANGKIQSTIEYVNNAKHGKEKWFYEDGVLYRESHFNYGKLNGKRTAYYNDGKLMFESFYMDGMPGLGLKEYDKNGNLKKQPEILVEEINNTDLTGEYIVTLSLSDKSSNALFYAGELTDGKYFNNMISPIRTKNGKGTTVFTVKKGSILMHTLHVVAKKKTYMRNELILEKQINLAVENR